MGRRNTVLLIANVIGAAVYVIGASHAWQIPDERAAGLHSITGEPFIWALYVFPVWILFGLLDLWWGASILARREWRGGRVWLFAALIWLASATIDFRHH
jgi:hypothetical protein